MADLERFNGFGLFIAAFCGLAFAYYVVLRLPKGLPRFISILPLLPIYLLLPWTIPFYHFRAVLSFIFLWTSPSKLLLLCWDAGVDYPLSSPSSFLYFVALMLFPIRVRGVKSKQVAAEKHPTNFSALWQLVTVVIMLNLYSLGDRIPLWAIYFMYSLHVYLGLELILGGLAKFTHASFGVELDPQFNSPILSASLSEFWGKRWNIVVTTILRATVYKPVLLLLSREEKTQRTHVANLQDTEVSEQNTDLSERVANGSNSITGKIEATTRFEKPSLGARALAMMATFCVSGLIHELIYFYINKSQATGEVTAFFILHGFATAVEVCVRRMLPRRVRLPRTIAVLCTLTFMYITVAWLLLPPLRRTGADLQTIAEYHKLQSGLMALFTTSWMGCIKSKCGQQCGSSDQQISLVRP